MIAATMDELRWSVTAEVQIDRPALGRARFVLGERLTLPSESDHNNERVPGSVRGRSWPELAAVLAGLHPWIEVSAPVQLRADLARLGATLVAAHGALADNER